MDSALRRPWVLLVAVLITFGGLVGEGVALVHVYHLMANRSVASGRTPALADALDRTQAPSDPTRAEGADGFAPWPNPAGILHGNPFADMEHMRRQMERQMRALWTAQPAFDRPAQMNLTEQPDRYLLTVQVPDLKDTQVRVDADAHRVTLHIERQVAAADQGGNTSRRNTSSVASTQSLGLAHPVDAAHVTIERSGNTMTVTLPKVHETRGTVI